MTRGGYRHEAIMLQKLSIMLLSSAPKITYYAFKKMPIIPKIMPLILATVLDHYTNFSASNSFVFI